MRSKISSGSAIRPTPSSPSAVSPSSGPISSTPRSRRVAAFAWVAGCDHMRGFIAGATSTGPRWASAASVSTSSASPYASLAIVFAVSGAITQQVGARQVRVEILLRRPACERGERLTADEAVRPVRDDGNDVVARP